MHTIESSYALSLFLVSYHIHRIQQLATFAVSSSIRRYLYNTSFSIKNSNNQYINTVYCYLEMHVTSRLLECKNAHKT